ncbi:TPA: cytochrome [Salmonella enterica]|nr:cytochrome [Salmonella enterica subsp. enterica]EHI2605068.1 cytochrome [Salmonella enterica]
MNINEMLAALSPKRESIQFGEYTFYARPMTLKEYNEHLFNSNKELRDEISIMRCIVDEEDKPIFSSVEQVRGLYTSVRNEMIGLVAQASLMPAPSEVEEEVK